MSFDSVDFDANATSPVHPEAWRAYCTASAAAWTPPERELARQRARRALACALNAHPDEVFFTSGGTAANALALAVAVAAGPPPGPASGPVPLVISALEHAAVRAAAEAAAKRGVLAVYPWPATPAGAVDLSAAEAVLACRPRLVSVLLAHNETGAVQPLVEVAARARAAGAFVHTDAVQAVGRMPVDFAALGVDMLSLSGHKFGAVGGIGALVVRRDTPLHRAMSAADWPAPALRGAGSWALERDGRAADNLPGLCSLTAAAGVLGAPAGWARVGALRDGLEADLVGALGPAHCRVVAAEGPRLPHVSCLHFLGAPAEAVLMALDVAGYAVSAGAACASGASEPSTSLQAMGLDAAAAREVVRVSLPSAADPAQVVALGAALADCARRARHVDA